MLLYILYIYIYRSAELVLFYIDAYDTDAILLFVICDCVILMISIIIIICMSISTQLCSFYVCAAIEKLR
jgi:hypothetical protein